MKILLFGKNGQVGSALAPRLPALGEVVALGRDEADLADADAVARWIREEAPAVVVNAAAYTAVDKAEAEPELAQRINTEAPAAMAEAAAEVEALLVHYSTDYVFDGATTTPYTEDDDTAPLNVYGRTKLAGEQAVMAAGGDTLIFRTAWVYSLTGRNFLKTMLRLAGERDTLRVVDDQTGAPTFAGAIADATVDVLNAVRENGGLAPARRGIYHMTCGGTTTWCGFTRKLLALAGLRHVTVESITTAEYPTPAARPMYSVLSNEKLRTAFGVALPHWEAALAECLEEREHHG